MITVRAGKFALCICVLLLAAGCSREQQDWRSAEAADTIESYDRFVQRHPDSELVTQARMRVTQLGEERDWKEAGSMDTVDAYHQFIAKHPNGQWSQEARIRIENFALGAQPGGGAPVVTGPPSAPNQPSATTPKTGLATPGEPAVAAITPPPAQDAPLGATPATPVQGTAAAPAQAAAGAGAPGGFGIQLGAFADQAAAQHEWQSLATRFVTELQGLTPRVVPADTPSGRLYRLQAGVPDEAHARSVCDALKRQSQACVPVLPH